MMKPTIAVLLLACGTTALRADLSYDQTAKITGGAMMGMMRFAGAFSKQAREPIVTHVYLKGDRLANYTADSAQITDVANETITSIDFKRKTYSVITFAEMAQAMAALGQRRENEAAAQAEVSMKVDVKASGQTREISGFSTREMVLTVEIETTDPKSGTKGTMTTTSNMWIAKDVAGYGQIKAFYERMAKKMSWVPGANLGPMAAGNPSLMKGMAAAAKESAKLDGAPLLQIVRMGMKGMPGEAEAGSQPQAQQTEPRTEAKSQEEAPSIGNVLGGRLGRLGGFGRRKKPQQEEQPKAEQPPQEQQAPPQQQQAAGGAPQGVLMESTIEMSGFSTASVDGAKLAVPAGFNQVENEMLKGMKNRK